MPFASSAEGRRFSGLLLFVLLITLIVPLAAVFAFHDVQPHDSLFNLANLVGPTTQSLLHGGGLTACTNGMAAPGNPICFHAARMPLPSLVVAAGICLFGDRVLPVDLLKTILFLLPIQLSILLLWRQPATRLRRVLIAVLLLLPFASLPFLADAVNLQVEEGYSYSFLALACALLFTLPRGDSQEGCRPILRAVLLALSIVAVYLAKSAMAPAAFVLVVAFLVRERRLAPRLLLVFLAASAPLGWALHQHHASGRYSLGTSLDGVNLHKGNNPDFLARYPPPSGANLDHFDAELSAGHSFPNEWAFNDFHQKAALLYIRTHPRQTIQAAVRKLFIIFFSLRKLGSSEDTGVRFLLDSIGILILRLALWAAILLSLSALIRRPAWTFPAAVFLAVVAACILPYVLGFAYTRHISVLLYPSVLLCCTALLDSPGGSPAPTSP